MAQLEIWCLDEDGSLVLGRNLPYMGKSLEV